MLNLKSLLIPLAIILALLTTAIGFAHINLQADTYDSVSKLLIDAMNAGEFRKLPGISTRLAMLKDPAAVPLMIAAVDAENTYYTIYGLGNFGLGSMTGVAYADSHNGEWWIHWWESNKSKYPPALRDAPLPKFKGSVDDPVAPKDSVQEKELAFCAGQVGKKAGAGQCTDLVIQALDSAGGATFKVRNGHVTWGELIYRRQVVNGQTQEFPNHEAALKIVPGDIVQYKQVVFDGSKPDGSSYKMYFGLPDHTDILLQIKEKGRSWKTYDQNINNQLFVDTHTFQLDDMRAGTLEVFAPKPR